jgi:hypothetical protein
MDWLDGAAKLLGVGAPLIYGGATYWAFHLLDGSASEEAKEAISNVLTVRKYDEERVSAALVEVFDRIYGRPLLRWKGFLRSATITILISIVFLWEVGESRLLYANPHRFIEFSFLKPEQPTIMISTFLNIFTDYLALFVVRWWLNSSKSRPFLALVAGFIIGVLAIFGLAFIRGSVSVYLINPRGWDLVVQWSAIGDQLKTLLVEPTLLTISAMAVFAWLPLFGVSILLLRLVEPITWAVGKTQWFLKDGKEHPLEAIGLVASVIVFGLAVVWQVFFKAPTA